MVQPIGAPVWLAIRRPDLMAVLQSTMFSFLERIAQRAVLKDVCKVF